MVWHTPFDLVGTRKEEDTSGPGDPTPGGQAMPHTLGRGRTADVTRTTPPLGSAHIKGNGHKHGTCCICHVCVWEFTASVDVFGMSVLSNQFDIISNGLNSIRIVLKPLNPFPPMLFNVAQRFILFGLTNLNPMTTFGNA